MSHLFAFATSLSITMPSINETPDRWSALTPTRWTMPAAKKAGERNALRLDGIVAA
jgi:hypothetical protein